MEDLVCRDGSEFFKLSFLKRFLLGTDGIIAGGCFKNIFNGEHVKDIDIFFRNKTDFNNANKKYQDDANFTLAYKNENVIAYKENDSGIVVELCKKTFGQPKWLLNNFDFSITKFCYYYETDSYIDEDGESILIYDYYVCHHPKFFEHLLEKKLVLDNSNLLYPFGTFERSYRYRAYGYGLCKESKIHLINAIRKAYEFNEDDLSLSIYNGID